MDKKTLQQRCKISKSPHHIITPVQNPKPSKNSFKAAKQKQFQGIVSLVSDNFGDKV